MDRTAVPSPAMYGSRWPFPWWPDISFPGVGVFSAMVLLHCEARVGRYDLIGGGGVRRAGLLFVSVVMTVHGLVRWLQHDERSCSCFLFRGLDLLDLADWPHWRVALGAYMVRCRAIGLRRRSDRGSAAGLRGRSATWGPGRTEEISGGDKRRRHLTCLGSQAARFKAGGVKAVASSKRVRVLRQWWSWPRKRLNRLRWAAACQSPAARRRW
jgi:hypothetical protein